MNELNKTKKISVNKNSAFGYQKKINSQLAQWKITMPKIKPLMSDFGLGDFLQTGLTEYWIANEITSGYCGKFLFVFDGQTCPYHRHKTKVETFFILKGSVLMNYTGKKSVMKQGDTLKVNKWKYHSFTGIGPALLLEISMPCIVADNYFFDRSIPFGGNYQK